MFKRPLKFRILRLLNRRIDQWFNVSEIADKLDIPNSRVQATLNILEGDRFLHRTSDGYAISADGTVALHRRSVLERIRNSIAFVLAIAALIAAGNKYIPAPLKETITIYHTPSPVECTALRVTGDDLFIMNGNGGMCVDTKANCEVQIDSLKSITGRIHFFAAEKFGHHNDNSSAKGSSDWIALFIIPDSLSRYKITSVSPITKSYYEDSFHSPEAKRIGILNAQTVARYEQSIPQENYPQMKMTAYWSELTINLTLLNRDDSLPWYAKPFHRMITKQSNKL